MRVRIGGFSVSAHYMAEIIDTMGIGCSRAREINLGEEATIQEITVLYFTGVIYFESTRDLTAIIDPADKCNKGSLVFDISEIVIHQEKASPCVRII
jgi:hypothetical protein